MTAPNNSKTNARKFLYITMLAFWGLLAVIVMDHGKKREPASILPAPKLQTENPNANKKLTTTVDTPFTVTITAVNGVPDHDEQELTLRADVVLNANIQSDVEWNWNLPEGASIVSGEKSDTWAGLKTGGRAHAEISLLNVSKEIMKTVTFTVKASTKNNSFDGIAAFATKANPDNLNSSLERSATHR
jgi:hypothetical protein